MKNVSSSEIHSHFTIRNNAKQRILPFALIMLTSLLQTNLQPLLKPAMMTFPLCTFALESFISLHLKEQSELSFLSLVNYFQKFSSDYSIPLISLLKFPTNMSAVAEISSFPTTDSPLDTPQQVDQITTNSNQNSDPNESDSGNSQNSPDDPSSESESTGEGEEESENELESGELSESETESEPPSKFVILESTEVNTKHRKKHHRENVSFESSSPKSHRFKPPKPQIRAPVKPIYMNPPKHSALKTTTKPSTRLCSACRQHGKIGYHQSNNFSCPYHPSHYTSPKIKKHHPSTSATATAFITPTYKIPKLNSIKVPKPFHHSKPQPTPVDSQKTNTEPRRAPHSLKVSSLSDIRKHVRYMMDYGMKLLTAINQFENDEKIAP